MGNPDITKSQSAEHDPKTSQDRLSEATSDKTVSDLEKGEGETSDSASSKPSDETSIPSPDGSSDPERPGRADDSDTSGPM